MKFRKRAALCLSLAACALAFGFSPAAKALAADGDGGTADAAEPSLSAVLDVTEAEAKGQLAITDTLSYGGLEEGKRYEAEGWVYLLDNKGNPKGEAISTAYQDLTPKKAGGTLEMSYLVEDCSQYLGKSLAVYEEIRIGWGDDNGKVVLESKDPKNKLRKVRFPKITLSGDTVTFTEASGTVSVDGGVAYSNLDDGTEYKAKWTLFSLDGYQVPLETPLWTDQRFTPVDASGHLGGNVKTPGVGLAGEKLYLKCELFGPSGKVADSGEGSLGSCHVTRVTSFGTGTPEEKRTGTATCLGDGEDVVTLPISYAGFPDSEDGYYLGIDLSVQGEDGREHLDDFPLAMAETSDFGDNTLDMPTEAQPVVEFVTVCACGEKRVWTKDLAIELDGLKLYNSTLPEGAEKDKCPLCGKDCLGTKKLSIKGDAFLQMQENARPRNRVTEGSLDLALDLSAYAGKQVHLWATLYQRSGDGADVPVSPEQKVALYVPAMSASLSFAGGEKTHGPEDGLSLEAGVSFTGLDKDQEYTFSGDIVRLDTMEALAHEEQFFTAGKISFTLLVTYLVDASHLSGKDLGLVGTLSVNGVELVKMEGEDASRRVSIREKRVPVKGTLSAAASIGGRVLEFSETSGITAKAEVISGLEAGKKYTVSMDVSDTLGGGVVASGSGELAADADGRGTGEATCQVDATSLVGHPLEVSVQLLDGEDVLLSRDGGSDAEMTVRAAGGDVEISENSRHVSPGTNVPVALSLYWSGLEPGEAYTVTPSVMDGEGHVVAQGKGTVVTPSSDEGTHHAVIGCDFSDSRDLSFTAGFSVSEEGGAEVIRAQSVDTVDVDDYTEVMDPRFTLDAGEEFPAVRYQEKSPVTVTLGFEDLEAGDYGVSFSVDSTSILEGENQEFQTASESGRRAFTFYVDGTALEPGELAVSAEVTKGTETVGSVTLDHGIYVPSVSVSSIDASELSDIIVACQMAHLPESDAWDLEAEVFAADGTATGVKVRENSMPVSGQASYACRLDGSELEPGPYRVLARLYLKDSLVAQGLSVDGFEVEDMGPVDPEAVALKANLQANQGKNVPCGEDVDITCKVKYFNLDADASYRVVCGLRLAMNQGDGSGDLGELASRTVDVEAGKVNGEVACTFSGINTKAYGGYCLMPSVSLVKDGAEGAAFEDLTEASGQLSLPGLPGDQLEGGTVYGMLLPGETLADVCGYWNLEPGSEYEIEVRLVEAVSRADLGPVKKISFTPESRDGSVRVDLGVAAGDYPEGILSTRAKLYRNGILVAERDNADEAVIRVPAFTGDPMADVVADGEIISVQDTFRWKNVAPVLVYKVVMDTVDSEDMSPVGGSSVEYRFLTNTAHGGAVDRPGDVVDEGIAALDEGIGTLDEGIGSLDEGFGGLDGTLPDVTDDGEFDLLALSDDVQLSYELDTTGLGGHKLIPRIRFYAEGDNVLIYDSTEDASGPERYIYVDKDAESKHPSITLQSSWEDGSVETGASKGLRAKGVVTYHDLDMGKDYTVKLSLLGMDGVAAEAEALFRPLFPDGVLEVYAPIDGEAHAGESFGVSAVLSLSGNPVAEATGSGLVIREMDLEEPDVEWEVAWKGTDKEEVTPGESDGVIASIHWAKMAGQKGVTFLAQALFDGNEISHTSKTFGSMEAQGDLELELPVDTKAYAGETITVRLIVSGGSFAEQRLMGRLDIGDAPEPSEPEGFMAAAAWKGGGTQAEYQENLEAEVTVNCTNLVEGSQYGLKAEALVDGSLIGMREISFLAEADGDCVKTLAVPVSGDIAGKTVEVYVTLILPDGSAGDIREKAGELTVKEKAEAPFEEQVSVSGSMEWEAGGTEIKPDGKQYALAAVVYRGLADDKMRRFTVTAYVGDTPVSDGYREFSGKGHEGTTTVKVPVMTDQWEGQDIRFALEVTGEGLESVTAELGTLKVKGEPVKADPELSGSVSWKGGAAEVPAGPGQGIAVSLQYSGLDASKGAKLSVIVESKDGVLSQAEKVLALASGEEVVELAVDTTGLEGQELSVRGVLSQEGAGSAEAAFGTLKVKAKDQKPEQKEDLEVRAKAVWEGGALECEPSGKKAADVEVSYTGALNGTVRTFTAEVLDGGNVVANASKTITMGDASGSVSVNVPVEVSPLAGKKLSVRVRVTGEGLEPVEAMAGELSVEAAGQPPAGDAEVKLSGTASWKGGKAHVAAGQEETLETAVTVSGMGDAKNASLTVSVMLDGGVFSQKTLTATSGDGAYKVELPVDTLHLGGKSLDVKASLMGKGVQPAEAVLGTVYVDEKQEEPAKEDLSVSGKMAWEDGSTETGAKAGLRAVAEIDYKGIAAGQKQKFLVEASIDGMKRGEAWKEVVPEAADGQLTVGLPVAAEGMDGKTVRFTLTVSGDGLEADVTQDLGTLSLKKKQDGKPPAVDPEGPDDPGPEKPDKPDKPGTEPEKPVKKEDIQVSASVAAPDGSQVILAGKGVVRVKLTVNYTGMSTEKARRVTGEASVGGETVGSTYKEFLSDAPDGVAVLEVPVDITGREGQEILFSVKVSGDALEHEVVANAGMLTVAEASGEGPEGPAVTPDGPETLNVKAEAAWDNGLLETQAGGRKRVDVKVSYMGISRKLPRTFTATVLCDGEPLGKAYRTIVSPAADGGFTLEVPVETDGLAGKSLLVKLKVTGEGLPELLGEAGTLVLSKAPEPGLPELAVSASWKDEGKTAVLTAKHDGLMAGVEYLFTAEGFVNGTKVCGASKTIVSDGTAGDVVLEVPVPEEGFEGESVVFSLGLDVAGKSWKYGAGSLVMPGKAPGVPGTPKVALRGGDAYGQPGDAVPFTAEYSGLEAGREYTVEVFLEGGGSALYKFTPGAPDGIVSGTVTNGGIVGGLVAGVKLLSEGTVVAESSDRSVLGRSVRFDVAAKDGKADVSLEGLEEGASYVLKVSADGKEDVFPFTAEGSKGSASFTLEGDTVHAVLVLVKDGVEAEVMAVEVPMGRTPAEGPEEPDGQPGVRPERPVQQPEEPSGEPQEPADTDKDDKDGKEPEKPDGKDEKPAVDKKDPDYDKPVFNSPVVKPDVDIDAGGKTDNGGDLKGDASSKTGLHSLAGMFFLAAGLCFLIGIAALLVRRIREERGKM